MAEIADILQADKPEGTSQVVLFVPSKNRDGDEIDQDYWVDEGLRIICRDCRSTWRGCVSVGATTLVFDGARLAALQKRSNLSLWLFPMLFFRRSR